MNNANGTITNFPTKTERRREGLPQVLMNLDSLLNAIDRKVLVPADDLGKEQVAEISREIGFMRQTVDAVFASTTLNRLPGSSHLMRN